MKIERHAKIIELIHEYEIETQEELAAHLNQAGYSVTQATISRDIRELNLTKVTGKSGRSHYEVLHNSRQNLSEKYSRVLRDAFLSMDMAQNILVIKTAPGMAMAVCAAIDALEWNEIVGSIAGDDTIMCAVRTVNDTLLVMNKIKKLIKNN